MKPFNTKPRKETQNPLQMDFLSAIPQPPKPLSPVEPGPDGTPPLPLSSETEPLPSRSFFAAAPLASAPNMTAPKTKGVPMPTRQDTDGDDIFGSDPFFAADAPRRKPEPNGDTSFEIDEIPQEDVPSITVTLPEQDPTPLTEPLPEHTAEERLLDTIVGSAPENKADEDTLANLNSEVKALRSELESALEKQQEALSSRDRARQDLQVFKTRFASLETDLASARTEAAKANQQKLQSETRYADAEKQWSDKLSQLRRMLDDVEAMRDELSSKRVSKTLFAGTLAAGILCTAIALSIGYRIGHTDEIDAQGYTPGIAPSSTETQSHSVAPTGSEPSRPSSPLVLRSTPQTSPHEHLPVPPSDPRATAKVLTTRTVTTSISLPPVSGGRWSYRTIGGETTVVFQYGLFSEGPELTSTAKQDLETIASALKGKRFRLEIEGHTDSTTLSKSNPNATSNKALGLSRAKKTSLYLIQQCGLSAEGITLSSAGEFRPPFPNTTAETRKMNRTVILKIREM